MENFEDMTEDTDTPKAESGPDIPPDHLSVHPRSPHYGGELLTRGIGINFKGQRKHSIEEYCVSEGWVRVQAGRTMDRKGNPLLIKLTGPVEAWFEDLGDDAPKRMKEG